MTVRNRGFDRKVPVANFAHQPVMLDEIIESFMGLPPGVIVDATLGGGGHAEALLECRDDFELSESIAMNTLGPRPANDFLDSAPGFASSQVSSAN